MKGRFTEEQIIGFLREADTGMPIAELCRKHAFSEASYYLWRNKFGGTNVLEARRLKELKTESARLKKLLAETMLENEIAKEALRKSGKRTVTAGAGAPSDGQRVQRVSIAAPGQLEPQFIPLSARHRSQYRLESEDHRACATAPTLRCRHDLSDSCDGAA